MERGTQTPSPAAPSPTAGRFRRTHSIVAWLSVIAAGMQFGLALVWLPGHRAFGFAVAVLALVLVATGLRGALSRSTIALSVALFVLVCLQGPFIALQRLAPITGTLHSIDGFVIFGVALVVAIESEDEGKGADRAAPFP